MMATDKATSASSGDTLSTARSANGHVVTYCRLCEVRGLGRQEVFGYQLVDVPRCRCCSKKLVHPMLQLVITQES